MSPTPSTVEPDVVARDTTTAVDDGKVAVKVWQLPVRLTHWAIVGSVIVLSVTGFYIGNPVVPGGSPTGYLMGTVRAVHLVAAWVFTVALVVRLVWMFVGNEWARWRQFVPTSRARWRGAGESLRFYLLVKREPPRAVGHNPLAGLTYLVVYTMLALQVLTGFALKALAVREGLTWTLTGWVFDVLSIPTVRLLHHMIMWLTLGFLVHHVYSAVLMDVEERSGIVSSIITGWKRIERKEP